MSLPSVPAADVALISNSPSQCQMRERPGFSFSPVNSASSSGSFSVTKLTFGPGSGDEGLDILSQ